MKPDHEPNVSELSRRELSREDRQEIWEGLDKRIAAWEQEQPKRRHKRIGRIAVLSFAATAATAVVLFVLPEFDTPQRTAPPVQEPYRKEAEPRVLIEQILSSAQLGQVPDCIFTAGAATISEVELAYGRADRVETAGDGRYATYEKLGLAFGFNEANLVFDVRSYRRDLQKISYQDVKTVLGQPERVTYYEDSHTTQDILHYQAGARHSLLLIFPRPTAQHPNPALHHISVLLAK